jgi:type IV pilus assembly protein PilA
MNKKGFTLIELLAVILILGIIALIAIPVVNNIIKEAKRGAFETTANNVVSAVEDACQLQALKG